VDECPCLKKGGHPGGFTLTRTNRHKLEGNHRSELDKTARGFDFIQTRLVRYKRFIKFDTVVKDCS
jgi:hypothetical protein